MSAFGSGSSNSNNRLRHNQAGGDGVLGGTHGAYGMYPHSEYREGAEQRRENDPNDKGSRLKGKVSMLKEVAINIGDEIRDQNQFLTTMGQDMEGMGGRLAQTMKNFYEMWARQGCGPFFYLTLFAIGVVVFMYIYLKAR
ncbi:protein transport protein bet1 [Coemansia sp. RSA 2399]|nr:protein transport protein bet1 [Coemansia sp. RSA 2399]